MGEEAREMVYTATNLIFIAAVLFVALMFFGLRTDYANTVAERQAAESRIAIDNRYKEYNFSKVTGYDVMSALTAYAKDTPMYVTGAYNFVNGQTENNLVYDKNALQKGTPWGTVSTSVDPRTDENGLQAIYRKESVYFAILTYDSDSPDQLLRDLELGTLAGRDAPDEYSNSTDNKIKWITNKYNAVRPNGHSGYTVSGVLFVCLHLEGVSEATPEYRQVAIY